MATTPILVCLMLLSAFPDWSEQDHTFPSPVGFDPLFPQRKTWWAKRISSYLFTAGRLTDVQIKQMADTGFGAIISHCKFPENSSVETDVSYATDLAKDVAINIAGLQYVVLFEEEEKWELSEIERLAGIIDSLKRPIVYHCEHSNTSTLFGLLYMLHKSKNPSFNEPLTTLELFEKSAAMGYNFTEPETLRFIKEVSGESSLPDTSHIEYVNMPDWFLHHSWILRPMFKNAFIAGQLRSTYFPCFKDRFHVYVNLRRSVISDVDQEPIQEEVTLINIKDKTGTYSNLGRQRTENLEKAVLNASRSNDYPYFGSPVNYQTQNPEEFGDSIGYNETWFREFIATKTDLEYVHTPIGDKYMYGPQMLEAYLATWTKAITGKGNVIFQCRRGYRGVIAIGCTVASAFNRTSTWALDRARYTDFWFREGLRTSVVDFFTETFPPAEETGGLVGASPGPSRNSGPYFALSPCLFIVVSICLYLKVF